MGHVLCRTAGLIKVGAGVEPEYRPKWGTSVEMGQRLRNGRGQRRKTECPRLQPGAFVLLGAYLVILKVAEFIGALPSRRSTLTNQQLFSGTDRKSAFITYWSPVAL